MMKILKNLPNRSHKHRKTGVTMVMDKGLSLRQAEDLINTAADYIDFIKLGFGTSLFVKQSKEKIKLYQDAGIEVYLGGTLFEAFFIREQIEDYIKLLDKLSLKAIEISDGSMKIESDVKLEMINKLSKNFIVLSEVGSKESGIIIAPNRWTKMMLSEIEAGSSYVIAEARESGTVGIYRPSGVPHIALVNKIIAKVPEDKIIWEAPQKSQQVWFIKQLGCNVNLGNIASDEIIPLETLRFGLRGDTFFHFLPDELKELHKE